MNRLNKIGVMSAATHIGAAMAVMGLLAGIVYSVGGFFVDLATIGLNPGTAMAFGALLGMPVIFGASGLVWGAVAAMVYNLVAARLGGMQMAWSPED